MVVPYDRKIPREVSWSHEEDEIYAMAFHLGREDIKITFDIQMDVAKIMQIQVDDKAEQNPLYTSVFFGKMLSLCELK